MQTADTAFFDFVRLVVSGRLDEVSRRVTSTPSLATTSSEVGATRQAASNFFLAEISHYLYRGDTALHMAAAAFRRPVAQLLVAHGANCRARNRRGAEPLHYASDANHWNPTAQAEIIEYLTSVGANPNALDGAGVAPLAQSGPNTILGRRTSAGRSRSRSAAAEQGWVDAVASCRSTHRAWRHRFSEGTPATGRHRQPSARARREADRSGWQR
jgi:Ankyrin repeats (many copies)